MGKKLIEYINSNLVVAVDKKKSKFEFLCNGVFLAPSSFRSGIGMGLLEQMCSTRRYICLEPNTVKAAMPQTYFRVSEPHTK